MNDELQRRMDADTRNGVFEVNPDHPAFGVSLCPMCGGEVDRHGDCKNSQTENSDAVKAIAKLCHWIVHEPSLAQTLAHRVISPAITVRELAGKLGIAKSSADERLHEIANVLPSFKPMLGMSGKRSVRQRARRAEESKARSPKIDARHSARCLMFYWANLKPMPDKWSETAMQMWRTGKQCAEERKGIR